MHLQHNAQEYVAKLDQRVSVARTIRSTFNTPDVNEANRLLCQAVEGWRSTNPKLTAWAEEHLADGFTVFGLPAEYWVRMRTSNGLERLSKEVKRCTRVATLFSDLVSCLRLVSANLTEQDKE